MKWADNLHTDNTHIRNLAFFKWRVEHGSFLPDLYLITLSTADSMQFDIIKASETKKKEVRKNLPLIIGFASGYDGALDVITQMTEECYKETGNADIRQYIKDKGEIK